MGDKVLTELDTHLIAIVFHKSSTVLMYKDILCGALGLTVGEREEIASRVDRDRSSSYSFWSVIINKWIEKNGTGATVKGLSMRLRQSDFNSTADELLKTLDSQPTQNEENKETGLSMRLRQPDFNTTTDELLKTLESQPTPNVENNKTDNVSTIVKKFEKIGPVVPVQFPKSSRISTTTEKIPKTKPTTSFRDSQRKVKLTNPVVPLPPREEHDTMLTPTTTTMAEHGTSEGFHLEEIVMSISIALFSNENGLRTLTIHDNTNVNVSKEYKSCLQELIAQGFRHPGKFHEFIGILLTNGLESTVPGEVIRCIFREVLKIDAFLRYSEMPSVCSKMVYLLDIANSEHRLGRLENMFKADLRNRNIDCAIVTNFLLIQVRRPSNGTPLVVPDDKITLPEATDTPGNHSVETLLVSIICYVKERGEFSVYVRHGVTTSWEYYAILRSGLIGNKSLLPGLTSKFDSMDSYHKYEIVMNDRLMGENERIHLQRILSNGFFFVYGKTGQRDTVLATHTQHLTESEGEREGINVVSYQGGNDSIVSTATNILAVPVSDQSGELDSDAGIGTSLSLGVGLKSISTFKVLPALLFALCYSPSSLDSIILCSNPENMYDKEASQVIHDIQTTLTNPLRRRHEGSYVELLHHFMQCDAEYYKLDIFDLWELLCERMIKYKPFVHFIPTSKPSTYGVDFAIILPHRMTGLSNLEHLLIMDASMNNWKLAGVPTPGLFINFRTSRFFSNKFEGMLCNLNLDLSHIVKSHPQAILPKLQLLAVFCHMGNYIVYHRQVDHDGIRWVLMDPSHKELKLLVNFEEDLLELFSNPTLPNSANEELRQFVQYCVCAIYVHM